MSREIETPRPAASRHRRMSRALAAVLLMGTLASTSAYAIPPGPPIRPTTFLEWVTAQLAALGR
jgi:hypothetical protein